MVERPDYIEPDIWAVMMEHDEKMSRDPPGPDDIVLCAFLGTQTPFTDNGVDGCRGCGKAVIFRPWARAARKMCFECAKVMQT